MIPSNRSLLEILAALGLLAAHATGQTPAAALVPAVQAAPVKDLAPVAKGISRELEIGELLPDIEIVNSAGERTRLSDFRGKALAVTFIYSRCSTATYCPLVSRNFDAAQGLLTRLNQGERCHLLSISMDAENDTPEILAAYAKGCQADARLWTFARANDEELRKLGSAVGLEYKRVEGRIDHNLRTVVVDAGGRIRKIYRGNAWTPQELAAELRDVTRAGG